MEALKQLILFLKTIISEDNGNPSTMRILAFAIAGVILFNWTYFNIQSGAMSTLDYQQLIGILSPLLLKGWQKDKEV